MKQLCVSLLKYASTASCSSCFAPPWSLMYPHQTKVTRIILQILILLFIIRLCIRISSIYPQEYTVRRLLTFHHTSSNDVLAFDLFYRHRTLSFIAHERHDAIKLPCIWPTRRLSIPLYCDAAATAAIIIVIWIYPTESPSQSHPSAEILIFKTPESLKAL